MRQEPTLDALISAILRRAAELVSPPGAWCQGASARDERGYVVPMILRASSYCATGAIYRAVYAETGELDLALYDACLLRLAKSLRLRKDRIAIGWNDHPDRQQAEVVAALERAGGVK